MKVLVQLQAAIYPVRGIVQSRRGRRILYLTRLGKYEKVVVMLDEAPSCPRRRHFWHNSQHIALTPEKR